jgi:hypothetical protein
MLAATSFWRMVTNVVLPLALFVGCSGSVSDRLGVGGANRPPAPTDEGEGRSRRLNAAEATHGGSVGSGSLANSRVERNGDGRKDLTSGEKASATDNELPWLTELRTKPIHTAAQQPLDVGSAAQKGSINRSEAIEAATAHLRKIGRLPRKFEIGSARQDEFGTWRVIFAFFTHRPGGHTLVRVSKDGAILKVMGGQ